MRTWGLVLTLLLGFYSSESSTVFFCIFLNEGNTSGMKMTEMNLIKTKICENLRFITLEIFTGSGEQDMCTMSWELWKHPDPPPRGRPMFFKPKWPKESKNGFKTISYRPYPLVFFSNYLFWYQKSSKKWDGITSSNPFPNNFYALYYNVDIFSDVRPT